MGWLVEVSIVELWVFKVL